MKDLLMMEGVRTVEGDVPELVLEDDGRWTIEATCEGGQVATGVDLYDLVRWLRDNHPDILDAALKS